MEPRDLDRVEPGIAAMISTDDQGAWTQGDVRPFFQRDQASGGGGLVLPGQVRLILALHPEPERLQGGIALGVGDEPATPPQEFEGRARHAAPVSVETVTNRTSTSHDDSAFMRAWSR